jgi:hypothetical protein
MYMSTKLKSLYAYSILVVAYALGTLLIPQSKHTLQRYHITSLHLKVLDATIILLFALIWFCAVYGFYNFRQYYQLIKKTKDGKPLANISVGLGLLAFWFPVTSVFNTYTDYFVVSHASLAGTVQIMQNYLSLLIPLIGFIFISIGARGLMDVVKQRPSLAGINILVSPLIVVSVLYVYLVSNTQNRLNGIYGLSKFYVLLTVVAPYIYMWFMGLLALYEIFLYRLKSPGILYRKSWRMLALGLGSLIIVSIIFQYLSTITERLNKLSLNWLLMFVYALLILLAVAYVLIAFGVRNLKKIEEV